jgi:hypothetical protein
VKYNNRSIAFHFSAHTANYGVYFEGPRESFESQFARTLKRAPRSYSVMGTRTWRLTIWFLTIEIQMYIDLDTPRGVAQRAEHAEALRDATICKCGPCAYKREESSAMQSRAN